MLRNHIISCGKPRKQFKQIVDLLQDKFWFNVFHILLFQGALEITSVWMMVTDEICWDYDHYSTERVTIFHSITGRILSVVVHQDWSSISSIITLPVYLKSNHICLPLDDTSAFFLFLNAPRSCLPWVQTSILNSFLSTSFIPIFRIKFTSSGRVSWDSNIN